MRLLTLLMVLSTASVATAQDIVLRLDDGNYYLVKEIERVKFFDVRNGPPGDDDDDDDDDDNGPVTLRTMVRDLAREINDPPTSNTLGEIYERTAQDLLGQDGVEWEDAMRVTGILRNLAIGLSSKADQWREGMTKLDGWLAQSQKTGLTLSSVANGFKDAHVTRALLNSPTGKAINWVAVIGCAIQAFLDRPVDWAKLILCLLDAFAVDEQSRTVMLQVINQARAQGGIR